MFPEKPLHGKITDFSKVFGTLVYTPKPGFMGTDFFTFKLVLGNQSSNLATIAITVDDDLTKAKKIAEQRKLGANVLQAKRSSLMNTLRSSINSGSLKSTSTKSCTTENPLAARHLETQDNRMAERKELEMSDIVSSQRQIRGMSLKKGIVTEEMKL
jgi:hypothetical protein